MTGSHPNLYPALMTIALSRLAAPSIILLSHTDSGREVAPRLGVRLKAGITMDCTKVGLDPATGELLLSKPVYGGNAIAVWAEKAGRTQVVTMRKEAPVERFVFRHVLSFLTNEGSASLDFRSGRCGAPPYNGFTFLQARFDDWMAKKRSTEGRSWRPA